MIDPTWQSGVNQCLQQAIQRPPVSPDLAKSIGDVNKLAISKKTRLHNESQVLWLVLQESRYDAIASGRLRWEARPKNATPPLRNNLRETIDEM